MNERMEKQLAFALEIDKVKNIFRQTHLSDNGRNENDAEHSWHMAVMAYLLREYANEEVDITKVMLMCLIHDIVEIDAGDTYAYDAEACRHKKPGRMPRRSVSSRFFRRSRRRNLWHCLTSSRRMRLQKRDLPMRWTISSPFY